MWQFFGAMLRCVADGRVQPLASNQALLSRQWISLLNSDHKRNSNNFTGTMAGSNIFDRCFEQVSESRQQTENIRSKLIEAMLELSEVKRTYNSKQKDLAEKEVELTKLVGVNQELKISLMKALIEKENLLSKKQTLSNNIQDLNQQIELLKSDSNLMLCGERVKSFCERNSASNQRDILHKIADAKAKLLDYGYPSNGSE